MGGNRGKSRRVSKENQDAAFKALMITHMVLSDLDNITKTATILQLQNAVAHLKIAVEEQGRALGFVINQTTQRFLRMWYVQRAIQLASNDYNAILQTAASKHLDLEGLAMFLTFALLPEIGGLYLVVKDLKGTERNVVQIMKTAGKVLDAPNHAVKGSAGSGLPDALEAANDVLKDLYDKCLGSMVELVNMEEDLFLTINTDPKDAWQTVQQLWKHAGWTELSAKDVNFVGESDVLRKVILYDMLRSYTGQYVTISLDDSVFIPAGILLMQLKGGGPLTDVPNKAVNVHGLNGDQRQKIYDQFRQVPWADTNRPALDSWRDLVTYWGATIPGLKAA